MKRRIGIFGCTADPFTLAHREIVKEALEQNLVDLVIIAPTIVDYHRGDKLPWLSSVEKLNIIRALTEDLDRVYVDATELNRKALCQLSPELQEHAIKSWRFIDTLLRIKIEHMNTLGPKNEDFYPIIGGDSLDNFKTWFAWKDILKQSARLIVVERSGNPIDVKKLISENPEFDGKLKTMKIHDCFAGMSASGTREMWRNQHPTNYVDWALATIEAIKATEKKKETLLHTPIFDIIKGKMTNTGLEPILVKAPDWVTIAVKRGSEFLIEKQFRYGSNCDIEEFPCGMVEEGENPHAAALRELEEETGIRVEMKCLQYLGTTNPNPAFMTNKMHYFYLDLDKCGCERRDRRLDPHEKIELHWESIQGFTKRIFHLAKYQSPKAPAILLSMLALLENAASNNIIEL